MKTNALSTSTAPVVAVHLDFKSVQYKPSYLPQLMADLASQGVNAVLAEYEDIFPFTNGIDVVQDRKTLWSAAALRRFQKLASENHIEIIPLQQCLGHLEYVFRWQRYRKLALDQKYPSVVNIDSDVAKALVFEMLEQVLTAHPESRWIHLGMDEAHALVTHAKASGRNVLDVFMEHLENLCTICEKHHKTPLIWSDMWEDGLSDELISRLQQFKDRIILASWDYGSTGDKIAIGRVSGFRTSRAWLNDPANKEAPAIGSSHKWIEEMPAAVRRAVGPHLKGRFFTPMFQADMWSKLGFRVIGASAIRSSGHLSVMPNYNILSENIAAWGRAIARTGQLGQIGTSWARGTTWCPPSYNTDLNWPLVADLARSMGKHPKPFFKGIPAATVKRIVATLGRCRADWRLEERIADEMESLLPKLKTHQHEWTSMIIMIRALRLHRRAEYAVLEVDFFHANSRPVPSEWDRRLEDQAAILRDFKKLRREARAHFGKRYYGAAFDEWLEDVFGAPIRRFADMAQECRRKKREAAKLYGC